MKRTKLFLQQRQGCNETDESFFFKSETRFGIKQTKVFFLITETRFEMKQTKLFLNRD